MTDSREQILLKCDEFSDGVIIDGENKIIAYDGDIQTIWDAMDENGKRLCLELLEYMAKNSIECVDSIKGYLFYYRGQYLTKEQLFENFL